jgi:pyruvate formate lyase activating enzyme
MSTLVYGRVIARHVDPIEKKPLFHYHPGSLSYSVATVGCNFRCRFCQNADIARMPADFAGRVAGESAAPADIVAGARKSGCASIAYTYTEPTIFLEFALETAKLAKESGIGNVFVTNGYMTEAAFETIRPYMNAANVDLKAFRDDFYKDQCGAKLGPVLDTLKRMRQAGVMVEVTTLLIPGLNDDEAELRDLTGFLVSELGPDTPWHISRFRPTYRLTDHPPTPLERLKAAFEIGRQAGLQHIYIGNVVGTGDEHTRCSECGATLIERMGFGIRRKQLEGGRCTACGAPVYGLGM